MKRNRGGERDLDHIILAAIRGLDRARLEYPQVRAGLILMMDRTFDARQNSIIVDKAIAWADRGVVGIDIAGPRPGGGATTTRPHGRWSRRPAQPASGSRFTSARRARTAPRRSARSSSRCAPTGSGTASSPPPPGLMGLLRDAGIVLEICPTSNLLTKALPDEDAVRATFRAFVDHGVAFTIATDGPEMMRTHLRDELELLERIGALDGSRARGGERPRARRELHPALSETQSRPDRPACAGARGTRAGPSASGSRPARRRRPRRPPRSGRRDPRTRRPASP